MAPHSFLLRSPPFPWVAPATAAVAVAGRSTLDDPDRLFAAMREARVGGAFWRDESWGETDAGVGAADDEATILAWIAGREVADPARTRAAAIAAVEAARYRDPFTGGAADAHHAVRVLAGWRRSIDANRPLAAAAGMAAWKRPAMAQFLWTGTATPRFAGADEAAKAAAPARAIAYWPSRTPAAFAAAVVARGGAAWQVEDGFLRSAGLGVECRPPYSVLIDRTGGIHFDPASVSEVEMILATHPFDRALLARAGALRDAIVAGRLGKYGVDAGAPPPPLPPGRRIVLAVGQVADDLSVLRGGGVAAADFMARVRAHEPDAFIVYRPHPDVLTGLRAGDRDGGGHADRVVAGGSLLALIERADAIHVLSSLTGFEALLRGKPVVVHGVPFYAGWGLTRDLSPVPARRGRTLSLDALVAGALILAPRYRDPVTALPCEPEVLVRRLAGGAVPDKGALVGFRRAYGAARRALAGARGA